MEHQNIRANRNSEGRITGLNINEVILWASTYQSREVQRRAQAAIPRLIALVTATAAVQSVNGVSVLREAGLTQQAANDAWLVIESRAAKHAFEFRAWWLRPNIDFKGVLTRKTVVNSGSRIQVE